MNKQEIINKLKLKIDLQIDDYILYLGTLYTSGEISEYEYDALVEDACDKSKFKKLKIKLVIGGYENDK